MHRQLEDMVEETNVAEIPSTEEGIYSRKLLFFIPYMHSSAFRFTDVKRGECKCLVSLLTEQS